MDPLSKIIQDRETPGLFIFDLNGDLVFSNHATGSLALPTPEREEVVVCEEIRKFCHRLIRNSGMAGGMEGSAWDHQVVEVTGRGSYSVRPFLIGDDDNGKLETYILFLVEKVIPHHEVDLDKSRKRYLLTKREAEVAGLVCKGCSNREISQKMFISEFTVKNHLKSIMGKTGAVSRNQMVALLR